MKDIYGVQMWGKHPLHPTNKGIVLRGDDNKEDLRVEWLPYSERVLFSIHGKNTEIVPISKEDVGKLIILLQEMIEGKHDYEY